MRFQSILVIATVEIDVIDEQGNYLGTSPMQMQIDNIDDALLTVGQAYRQHRKQLRKEGGTQNTVQPESPS